MRELLRGALDLLRGFRMWGTSPRLMLLGAVPAVIVGIVFVGLLVGLWLALPGLVDWLTPFADGWDPVWRELVQAAVGLAVLLLAGVLLVLGFTAVTLTVGDPFYERISRRVEERLGDPPAERDEPLLRGVLRALGDGVRLFLAGVLVALLCFAVGFVPIVGAVLAFVLGAVLGGRLLAVELTGYAFDVRGRTLTERRRMLAGRRMRALGFGGATYLLFLVPFVAVVAMPAAVAGATMLSRELLEPGTESAEQLHSPE